MTPDKRKGITIGLRVQPGSERGLVAKEFQRMLPAYSIYLDSIYNRLGIVDREFNFGTRLNYTNQLTLTLIRPVLSDDQKKAILDSFCSHFNLDFSEESPGFFTFCHAQ